MSHRPTEDFFTFLLGSGLFAAGVFLFTNQVLVGSGYPSFSAIGWRGGGFFQAFAGMGGGSQGPGIGLLLLPFGCGIALLWADQLRRVGWFLVVASAAALTVAVLQSLLISFRPTSLWMLMAMVVMIAGGAGLMSRALRGYPAETSARERQQRQDASEEVAQLRRELEELRDRLDLPPR